ncbi:MAG: SatD family protein [Balneolaceae bacterium]|nr:SatD family protein [Balneolaceae bacterium]
MDRYIAIIGDIEASKELDKSTRAQTQEVLDRLFKEKVTKDEGVVSPYTLTLGDEFQALYDRADYLFHHIWTVAAAIYPVMVRWSIGSGDIDTKINRERSVGMDGPAFHKARNGMEQLKKEQQLFRIETGDELYDSIANSSLKLLTASIRSWKKNRMIILERLYSGAEVKQIASELDVSDVAVYKNIHAGNLSAIMEYTEGLTKLLNR